MYFDKTVDLQDVDRERIPPHKLIWPGVEYKIGPEVYCDWNLVGASMPVKILSHSKREGINLKIIKEVAEGIKKNWQSLTVNSTSPVSCIINSLY